MTSSPLTLSRLWFMIIIHFLVISVFVLNSIESSGNGQLPPGYFAFEKATKLDGIAPRLRKPPYMPADVPCAGAVKSDYRLSPKDTLCGDLNRGYVPLNPMYQNIDNQPYPFELIKNKTLHFLARALPYLKADINNIPKVAKLPINEKLVSSNDYGNRYHYEIDGRYHHMKKRSAPILDNVTSSKVDAALRMEPRKEPKFLGALNLTETRQKYCDQGEGILCHVVQAVSGNGGTSGGNSGTMLNTLSQLAQVMSAASNAANTAQNVGSLINAFTQLTNSGASGTQSAASSPQVSIASSDAQSANSDPNNKSMLSQVLNVLASFNNNGQSNSGASVTAAPTIPTNSNFSPLTAIVDYLMSSGTSRISSLLPARRKKPLDFEDIGNDLTGSSPVSQVPPNPCPAIEEYVAPVYARNYQGVWKYVVQIPHEGYFTQTVQKTSCVKSRCDFMEGFCHDSPRWVSLLVAETFYPHPKFSKLVPSQAQPLEQPKPISQPSSNSYHHQPMVTGSLQTAANNLSPVHYQKNYDPQSQQMADYLSQYGQYQTMNDRKQVTYREDHSHRGSTSDDTLAKPRRLMKRNSDKSGSGENNNDGDEECDGYDNVGCYNIRVYYDWFLVPGSCKCWRKTSTNSGLDTIKKIFAGRR